MDQRTRLARGTDGDPFMDDVTLLCSDLLLVQRALDVTDWFGRASGAKLNRTKSEAQLFGLWENIGTDLDLDIKETDKDFRNKI